MLKQFLVVLTVVSIVLLSACEQSIQKMTVKVFGLNGQLIFKHSDPVNSRTYTVTEDGYVPINVDTSFFRPGVNVVLSGLSPASFFGHIEVLSQPDQQACLGSYISVIEQLGWVPVPPGSIGGGESDFQVYCVDNMILDLAIEDNNLAALIQLIAIREGWTEVADITFIRGGVRIKSLAGLEELPSLRSLDLFSPGLQGTDVSRLTELTGLSIWYQFFIKGLDLSKNSQLENLDLISTNLEALDLSHNRKLISLRIDDSRLSNIDVSNNTLLTELLITKSQLSTIDLSHNTLLTELDISYNRLSTIDVSQNVNLQNIDLSFNNLTDISSLLALPNVQTVDLDGDESKNSQIPCTQLDALAAKIGDGLIRPPLCVE